MKMPPGATILAYLGSIGLVLVLSIGATFLFGRLPLSVAGGTLQTELRKDPRFAALSVYAEAPFDDDVFVYLGGELQAREHWRIAREWVYAHGPKILGRTVVAVMDQTQWPRESGILRVEDYFQHDARPRPLTKYLMAPRRGTGDRAFFQKLGTAREHIDAIVSASDMREDLVALGPVRLADALLETYKQLTLYRMGVYTAEDQVARTQMMLEVWAKMPPQDVLREKSR